MGVWHERGEAKIDHLVKDWLRLQLIFHHQAWMTKANARGVDEACRERRVSRMELACRHATRDYLFKNPGHALVVLAHDRPVFSYRGCDQFVQLAIEHGKRFVAAGKRSVEGFSVCGREPPARTLRAGNASPPTGPRTSERSRMSPGEFG